MRFDKARICCAPAAAHGARIALLACLALAACADLPDARPAAAPAAQTPAEFLNPARAGADAAKSAKEVVRSTPAARPVAPGSAPLPAELSPTVLRAFDDALQALHEGHADAAEKDFVALVHSNPELGGPHANLGIIYRHADKLDQAVAELELAVHSSPQQPVYWNQLGITYRQQGQFTKARAAYEKAIEIDPGYPVANLNLGLLFDLYLWDSTRALQLYDRYLALSPGGDEKVSKWVADLKNRSREKAAGNRKEQE